MAPTRSSTTQASTSRTQLRALTLGRGVDIVYDCVGGSSAEPALRAMAWQGRFLVVGFAAGGHPGDPAQPAAAQGLRGPRRVLGRGGEARRGGPSRQHDGGAGVGGRGTPRPRSTRPTRWPRRRGDRRARAPRGGGEGHHHALSGAPAQSAWQFARALYIRPRHRGTSRRIFMKPSSLIALGHRSGLRARRGGQRAGRRASWSSGRRHGGRVLSARRRSRQSARPGTAEHHRDRPGHGRLGRQPEAHRRRSGRRRLHAGRRRFRRLHRP